MAASNAGEQAAAAVAPPLRPEVLLFSQRYRKDKVGDFVNEVGKGGVDRMEGTVGGLTGVDPSSQSAAPLGRGKRCDLVA